VNFWNIFQSRPPRTASGKPIKPATSARTLPPTPAPSQHRELDTLGPIVTPAPLNKHEGSYTTLPEVTLTGRPYTAPHATRMHTGVGIYPGKHDYVAAQFSEAAKNILLSEISANLHQQVVPVESAHLTLIPPSDKIDIKQTTRQLLQHLDHSTLIFKRVVITRGGAVLLIPEETTSAKVLKKQLTKIADANGLPQQSRDLHVLLGHVNPSILNRQDSHELVPYPGDHRFFQYSLPLIQPFSVKLSLTSEGNLISEQLTARLQKVPSAENTDEGQLTEATLCFEERAANVEMLADTFLRTGTLSEADYQELSYDHVRPNTPAYKNNPIYFSAEMLRKAREEKIPLSFQMVPLNQIDAVNGVVGQELKFDHVVVDYPQTDGSTTRLSMAVIHNAELVLQAFQRDLHRVFGGFDDVVVQQVGSGVTGFSRNPDKPIKPCDTISADIDLAVKSRQIIEHLEREEGMKNISINRKIKLANKYTVIANSPKADNEIGFGDTDLGRQIQMLSRKWSFLLAAQSPKDNELDPVVDFKLNIAPRPFQEASTLLDMRSVRPPTAQDRIDDLKGKPNWTSWLVGPLFFK